MKKPLEFKQIGKLSPSNDFKEQAKKRLMQKIRQDKSSWLEFFLYDFQKIKASDSFHLLSKERLLCKIAQPTTFSNLIKKVFFNKKFLSLATSCGILFVSIFTFSLYTPQTAEASNSVYLVITEGNPIIKQLGGTWEMAKQLQELKIGDKIQTDYNDVVEVHFFNNSVTRLAHDTELTITTFFKQKQNEKVELELNNGRVWNKVIQAVSNPSDFTVKTHNSSVSTKNATFDILASEDEPTAINVIDHLIDVKILQKQSDSVVAKTKVTEGYKVEVQVSSKKTIAQTAQITPIENKQNDLWFQENLEKDQVHINNLEKQREEKIIAAAGILPTSPLYSVKKGFEGAKKVMTNSDKPTEELTKIKQKFQEAAALSTKSEDSDSEIALLEFKIFFNETKNKGTLNTELAEMLVDMQNDYVAALPGTQDYKIKDLLRELELEVAEDPSSVLLKRTTEKLFEAQDLFENGTPELAANLLASINEDQILLMSATGALLEENKKATILQKTEELQILQALKENVKSSETTNLVALVDTIYQNTIQEINKLAPQPEEPKTTQIIAVKKDNPNASAQEFIDKMNIYKTQRGQENQLLSLLKKIPNNTKQIATLTEIKKLLPIDKQHLVTQKILKITNN